MRGGNPTASASAGGTKFVLATARYDGSAAYGDAETKRQALENGTEALLTKPIDFKTLRSEIDMRVECAA